MQAMTINDVDLGVVEYNGQRVLTFRNIDDVHHRLEGTARKRFFSNKKRFALGKDYYMVYRGDNAMSVFRTLEIPPKGITLITLSGYLMLVKSFTDDLAWKVQRELVNCYFKVKSQPEASPLAISQPRVPLAPPTEQMSIELPKHRLVVDTPRNREALKTMNDIQRAITAMSVTVELFNRFMSEKDAECYKHIIDDLGMRIVHFGDELRRVRLNLIEEPK